MVALWAALVGRGEGEELVLGGVEATLAELGGAGGDGGPDSYDLAEREVLRGVDEIGRPLARESAALGDGELLGGGADESCEVHGSIFASLRVGL